MLKEAEDITVLQNDINLVMNWFELSKMKVNVDKCFCLHVGGHHHVGRYTIVDYEGNMVEIPNKDIVVDLGIKIDSNISFKEHIYNIINKANIILAIISRNFRQLSVKAFLCLYKSLVRSQLEYGVQVWNPHNVGLVEALERVQKRASKLVHKCRNMSYIDRLRLLRLPTLGYRRRRADLILMFNISAGMLDPKLCPKLTPCPDDRTRGHNKKLCTRLAHRDCRKFYFSNRVVNDWNSLPHNVINAPNVMCFKILLDEFFGDAMYEY